MLQEIASVVASIDRCLKNPLDVYTEYFEALFDQELYSFHESARTIRGEGQVEGFLLLRLQGKAGGRNLNSAAEIARLRFIN